jgi:hypothetical protein
MCRKAGLSSCTRRRVYYAADQLFTYQFDAAELELRATSGLPW